MKWVLSLVLSLSLTSFAQETYQEVGGDPTPPPSTEPYPIEPDPYAAGPAFCYIENMFTTGGLWCILTQRGADGYNNYYGVQPVNAAHVGDIVGGAHAGPNTVWCTDNMRAQAGCH